MRGSGGFLGGQCPALCLTDQQRCLDLPGRPPRGPAVAFRPEPEPSLTQTHPITFAVYKLVHTMPCPWIIVRSCP